MMKRLIPVVCLLAAVFCTAAIVSEDYQFKGVVDFDTGAIWKIKGTRVTASAAELNLSDGLTVTTAELNQLDGNLFTSTFTLSATALNVTNGQAVTVAAGSYVLNGIGGANDSTNTITLSNPERAGQVLVLVIAKASSNLVTIADSTTVAASGAILLDGDDTATFVANGVSNWCLTAESDN